ncbi:MAG: CHRD domain-containing protein, partial [Steroidobacteraceae bacterium]
MLETLRTTRAMPTALRLMVGTLLSILAACGGGYGGGSGGGSGATGCGGYGGNNCPAPTIMLSSPGATVERTVQLSASASAASGAAVMSVDFLIDGASVGKATTAPYTISWDSTVVSDGSHMLTAVVIDSRNQMTTSAAIAIKVANNPSFTVAMAPAQIFPAPTSSASGTADLSAKLATGAVSGKVTLSGVAATAVTINEGFAGNTGSSVITLTANAGTPGEWDVPAGALLSADQVTALLVGKLYVIATSAAHPGGELRGQITPANVSVILAALA